jgi:SAM-dependent methyltransferase
VDAETYNSPAASEWNRIAAHWDEQVGEGTDFHKQLVFPATEQLLAARTGERVMDACCGNGNFTRRLLRAGCSVVAFDGASAFVDIARKKHPDGDASYHVVDACDEAAIRSLAAPQGFDAIVCNMAMMDLPTIDPLLRAARSLLKPGGRFVWSVGHPSFHTNESQKIAIQDDGAGEPEQRFGCIVTRYLTEWPHETRGLLEQPVPNKLWHRPMSQLFRACFDAGFVIDGVEEPAFAPDTRARSPFSWARRTEIPPVLVVRCREAGE